MTKVKAADERRGTRRRGRRRTQIVGGAAVAVLIAVVAYFAYRAAANQPGIRVASQGNEHIQSEATPHVAYSTEPPTSGPHLPYVAPWGVHTSPVLKELQVHNLEDGGVLVQYSCDCPDLVEKLRSIVARHDRHVILAPYPGMKSKIALTAWQRIDQFDEFDERRITRFIDAYVGIDHHPK
jgi:hypothetical protein